MDHSDFMGNPIGLNLVKWRLFRDADNADESGRFLVHALNVNDSCGAVSKNRCHHLKLIKVVSIQSKWIVPLSKRN